MTAADTISPSFDTARPAPRAEFVPCSDCKQPIRTYYYALNGDRPVCAKCKGVYADRIRRGSGPGAMTRVLLHGGAAAAGLALVLGGLLMMMGFLRIFAAVAVGYLIGRAINWTTGHFYDRRYQIVAAVLTYVTLGVATVVPVIVEASRAAPPRVAAAPVEQPKSTAPGESPWAEADSIIAVADANNGRLPAPDVREPTAAERLREGNAFSRFMNTLAFIALLPVLGLLTYGIYAAGVGVFALGFGIRKAWEITGECVAYELSGPHRVGTGPIGRTF